MLIKYLHNFRYYYSTMHKQLLTRVDCEEYLKANHIEFRLYEHDPVFTMEEMQEKVKLERAPLIKNLFFTDKKPNTFFLAIAKLDTKLEKGIYYKFMCSFLEKSRSFRWKH
jgi:hypothetical protein